MWCFNCPKRADEQVYVASFCQIAPLWIHKNNNTPESLDEGTVMVPQAFPSALQVSMRINPTHCSQEREDLNYAKSLNYFVDAESQTVVEMQPTGPHTIYNIDLNITNLSEAPIKDNATIDIHVPEPPFYTPEQRDLADKRNYFE